MSLTPLNRASLVSCCTQVFLSFTSCLTEHLDQHLTERLTKRLTQAIGKTLGQIAPSLHAPYALATT